MGYVGFEQGSIGFLRVSEGLGFAGDSGVCFAFDFIVVQTLACKR